MLHKHGWKTICFTWVTSAVLTYTNIPAVCGWVIKWVQSMWSCVCCCPLHPVCDCMTDRCQACHEFPGRSGWDVQGQGEMKAVEGRAGKSLSFHSGFSVSDMHPHPRIVYQHQQMTDKGAAQPPTGPHQGCGCVCAFVRYVLEWLTQVLPHKTMPCHHFARSASSHSDDQMLQC